MINKSLYRLMVLILLGLVMGCLLDNKKKQAGGTGEETTNGISVSITYPDGSVPDEATAFLRPKNYLADNSENPISVDLNFDDSSFFLEDSLSTGEYFLEIKTKDSLVTLYELKIVDTDSIIQLPPQLVEKPGLISGYVILPIGYTEAEVKVYGLERSTLIHAATGYFEISVPMGVFDMYILPKDSIISASLLTSISVSSDDTTSIGQIQLGKIIPDGFNNQIIVTVIDQFGVPVVGSVVKLIPHSYNPTKETLPDSLYAISNSNGDALFQNIFPGNYNLESIDLKTLNKSLLIGVIISPDTIINILDTLNPTSELSLYLPDSIFTGPGSIYIGGTDYVQPVGEQNILDKFILLTQIPEISNTDILFISTVNPDNPKTVISGLSIISGESKLISMYNNWNHNNQIQLNLSHDSLKINTSIINYPLLIKLDESNFNFSQAKLMGEDIRFSKTSGFNSIPFEIENWDNSNKTASIWLSIDTLDQFETLHQVTMYWGNTSAGSISNSYGVFDSTFGFSSVWHFSEGENNSTSGFKDATPHQSHGTGFSFTQSSSEKSPLGEALSLNGMDQYIQVPNGDNFQLGTGDFSVSVVMYLDSLDEKDQIFSKRAGTGSNFEFEVDSSTISLYTSNSGKMKGSDSIHAKTWYIVCAVRESGIVSLYINGKKDIRSYLNNKSINTTNDLLIGRDNLMEFRFFQGVMDEMRISRVARSQDWIKMNFWTQFSQKELINH